MNARYYAQPRHTMAPRSFFRALALLARLLALIAGMLPLSPAQGAAADTSRPVVKRVQIGDGDVMTSRDVTLRIEAEDNVGVKSMYIEEWHLVKLPAARAWGPVRNSGWVPYQSNYNWTLGDVSGTHFILVWVSDAARNVSKLERSSADFVSMLKASDTLEKSDIQAYLVAYKKGENVKATLSTQSGDADLYVWHPFNFFFPDHKSNKEGTATDTVSFTTPRDGLYVFVVYGYKDSTYSFQLTPKGGNGVVIEPPTTNAEPQQPPIDKIDDLTNLAALAQAGLDPLDVATDPAAPTEPTQPTPPGNLNKFVYLPLTHN